MEESNFLLPPSSFFSKYDLEEKNNNFKIILCSNHPKDIILQNWRINHLSDRYFEHFFPGGQGEKLFCHHRFKKRKK